MEPVKTPRKSDINILSNILLSDDIFNCDVTKYRDIPNKENVDCQTKATKATHPKEPPVLFKNLAFELPILKRKNSSSDNKSAKKQRTELIDDCCDADNEVKIFNYLTGTYESVKQNVKEEMNFEDSIEIKEENLSFDDDILLKEDFETAPGVVDNSGHNVASIVLDDTVVKNTQIEPLKLKVFDNTVLNTVANSAGPSNSSILLQILKEPSPQVLKSLPIVDTNLQPLNHNNVNDSLLLQYLTLNVSNSNGDSGNVTNSHVIVLDELGTPAPLPDSSVLKSVPFLDESEYNKCNMSDSKGDSGNAAESDVIVLDELEQLGTPAPLSDSSVLKSAPYWWCKSCSYTTKSEPELMLHIRSAHSEYGETLVEISNRKNEPKRPQNKIGKVLLWRDSSTKCDVGFKCLHCKLVFAERSQLETHTCLIQSVGVLSEKFIRDCNKCIYKPVFIPRKSSSNVHGNIQGQTVTNSLGEQNEINASNDKNGQTSSILYSLLTEDEYGENNPPQETIEIISDEEMSDASRATGPSPDNIVELPGNEKRDPSSSELFKHLCAPAKNGVGEESASVCKVTEVDMQQLEFNDVMDRTGPISATEKETLSEDTTNNQATSEMEVNNETTPNLAESETNENNDVSPEVISSVLVNGEKNDDLEDECSDVNDDGSPDSDIDADDLSIDQHPDQVVSENHHTMKFQCFDCRYSNVGDLTEFRLHVAKHVGSKFRCMPHSDAKEKDCPKCCYENTLGDLEKHVKRCPNCGFATEDASEFQAHKCDVSCSPGDVKCFHCPYVTSRKKYLYYHAADHVQEGFACAEHSTSSDACLECAYERCLRMAKKDVLDCEICGFKTVIIAVFDVHQCNKTCVVPYTCWDCSLDSFKSIDELRDHAVAHYKSEFRCEDHKSAVNNCSQCLYQALAESLEGSVFVCEKCHFRSLSEESFARHTAGGCSVPATSSGMRRVTNPFQCFLCDYKTSSENLLKYHCKKHYDETFACENHTLELPQVDCPKCTYQKLLSWSQKSLLVCKKCGFKTFNSFHFKSHTSKCHSALSFKCFDCAARFKSFKSLKYHAIRHSYSKFKCTEHSKSNQAATCQKCTYENTLRIAKENSLTCKKCGFKTYIWTLIKLHESDEAHCEAYKAKLAAQGAPVARPKPAETYSCFDCDFSHDRLDYLKAHVKEHRTTSKFQCDEHETPHADCPKCRYVQLLTGTTRRFNFCYDCNRRKSYVNLLDLRAHVVEKHSKSNFACKCHVQKKENSCGKCFYQKVVEEVLADDYVKLICWDCNGKLFTRMAPYENHIEYTHGDSKYSCPEHCGKKHKRCSKCFYQNILQGCTAETSRPKTVTFQCFQCNYSHKQIYIFRNHVRSCHANVAFQCHKHSSVCSTCPQCFYYKMKMEMPNSHSLYRCYECDDSRRAFRNPQNLKSHIRKAHENCSFVCSVHSQGEVTTNCAECLFEIFARDVARKREYGYECSSCSYKSDSISSFMAHEHRKFKCKDHTLEDCSRCFNASIDICYACAEPTPLPNINALKEHILDKHKTGAFTCPSHTVKTVNCDKCLFQRLFREHQRAAYLQCFDCDYTTLKFTELRSHAWKHHSGSQYQCAEHCSVNTPDCPKCLYATVLENANV